MEILIALIIGFLAGLHTSTWGMYKDSPHEGFTYRKYFRSTVIGAMVGTVVWLLTRIDLTQASQVVVLFGFTYGVERAILEFYKTFLREEDQSKYFIPMQFHVKGKIVQERGRRLIIGALYLLGVVTAMAGVYGLQKTEWNVSGLVVVLCIGTVGGWISAVGGAWKDAPLEGFELLKFFRSPVIAFIYALILANFTNQYLFICVGALGYTVATIETYKTFLFPSKPRGKFAGKPILCPEMLKRRQKFVPLYVAIWAAILTTLVIAFLTPHQGLLQVRF
ncbi:MAG: hypothetical protein A2Z27_05500 [candidate division Zixibacteria bacterium RBG_16_50_21]|nr:MAG: hypothetical protein A2Z27_05500 [candidate division Zixibacteria bacterium RBG_16_50_21]